MYCWTNCAFICMVVLVNHLQLSIIFLHLFLVLYNSALANPLSIFDCISSLSILSIIYFIFSQKLFKLPALKKLTSFSLTQFLIPPILLHKTGFLKDKYSNNFIGDVIDDFDQGDPLLE